VTDWLVLIYRIPSEPTRLRAAAWRRLKGLGAIYLQNSVAALPSSPAAERALRKLRHEIDEMGGTALLLSAAPLVGDAEILAAFQAARNDEYAEIVDRCEDFQSQVAKEYQEVHFTFAELEENEVDLVKLQRWFDTVSSRDVFSASGRQAAVEALARCAGVLEDYASRVYEAEAEGK
jgi:DNA-binding transcriptional regulator PaaX